MTGSFPQAVTLHGACYSVYTRIARLALEEKGVAYRFEEVDIFAADGPPAGYAARHPFARIPALEHDGFRLYETAAITRYVDEAFGGAPLQPAGPRDRARMNQAISIMDAYAFRTLVWDVFVERVRVPEQGGVSDEPKIRSALQKAETILRALMAIKADAGNADAGWIAGPEVTLADLHAAPMLILFRLAPEGAQMMADHPELDAWLPRFNARPAARRTRFPVEQG